MKTQLSPSWSSHDDVKNDFVDASIDAEAMCHAPPPCDDEEVIISSTGAYWCLLQPEQLALLVTSTLPNLIVIRLIAKFLLYPLMSDSNRFSGLAWSRVVVKVSFFALAQTPLNARYMSADFVSLYVRN